MENILSNTGKVNFEGLVHLLRYIRDSKNLVLQQYANIQDAPLSDLLIQASIKIYKQLIVLSDSIWQDYPDTAIITGEYILFYQGVPIDHCTHVPGAVDQSSAESEYNSAGTA